MSYLEKAQALYDQIAKGEVMAAFERYYDDKVVMVEPTETREGKEFCRQYEIDFLESIEEFHGLDVKSMSSDEEHGTVFIEVAMDVTFKGGNRVNMEQVAVQKWEGNHIIHERFYYNAS